jgi:hypothetical protein
MEVPSVAVPVVPAKVHKNKGKIATEKQLAALRGGMAKLKEKREAIAKEKEERVKTNDELRAKGLPAIEPPIKLKKKEILEMKAQAAVLEPVTLIVKERKVRADKGQPKATSSTAAEFREMKAAFLAMQKPAEIKEVVREVQVPERVVEKIVEKERMLSGSDLLNKIFFNK